MDDSGTLFVVTADPIPYFPENNFCQLWISRKVIRRNENIAGEEIGNISHGQVINAGVHTSLILCGFFRTEYTLRGFIRSGNFGELGRCPVQPGWHLADAYSMTSLSFHANFVNFLKQFMIENLTILLADPFEYSLWLSNLIPKSPSQRLSTFHLRKLEEIHDVRVGQTASP
uniref:Uncharacterized protein n=1 Tax=Cucumis melo TaxID=3656 RepID=A0A9I9E5G5_CUCME